MPEKPTLILIPGLLCDQEVWAEIASGLKPACDPVSLGFMNHASIGEMADAVLRAAPETFSVAGHSMGGRVALEVVRRAPERVERLALLDTGHHAARPGEGEARAALLELAFSQGMYALAKRWLPPMVRTGRHADGPLMDRLTAMVERADVDLFRKQINALLTRPDAWDQLPAIACDTCVIVGREDQWSPPEQHREIASRIPNAELVVVAEAGHMSPVEQPEAVTRALAAWIQRPAVRPVSEMGAPRYVRSGGGRPN